MKTITKYLLPCYFWFVIIALPLLLIAIGCSDNIAAPPVNNYPTQATFVALGFDQSSSLAGYKQQDTGFLVAVCQNVAATGGVVIAYGIGEPSDQSGLRCYLALLPKMNNDLVLSKRAKLKQDIEIIAAKNKKEIQDFLEKVQAQIFDPIHDDKKKIKSTDINGFFKKIDVLLGEPENQNMRRYVFVYSDGIHSLLKKDSPASYKFKANSHFTLCLSGWKTKSPCDSVEIEKFEDPQGFLQYINVTNFNN